MARTKNPVTALTRVKAMYIKGSTNKYDPKIIKAIGNNFKIKALEHLGMIEKDEEGFWVWIYKGVVNLKLADTVNDTSNKLRKSKTKTIKLGKNAPKSLEEQTDEEPSNQISVQDSNAQVGAMIEGFSNLILSSSEDSKDLKVAMFDIHVRLKKMEINNNSTKGMNDIIS